MNSGDAGPRRYPLERRSGEGQRSLGLVPEALVSHCDVPMVKMMSKQATGSAVFSTDEQKVATGWGSVALARSQYFFWELNSNIL